MPYDWYLEVKTYSNRRAKTAVTRPHNGDVNEFIGDDDFMETTNSWRSRHSILRVAILLTLNPNLGAGMLNSDALLFPICGKSLCLMHLSENANKIMHNFLN